MIDINILKRKLIEDVRGVCAYLLPQGKIEGQEFVADPGHGKIKVVLKGTKSGVWSHFGSAEAGGDLIDLWCYARGKSLVEALDDIRDYLGIEQVDLHSVQKKTWVRPAKPKVTKPKNRARDYLCEDRNIPEEILDLYKIGEQGDSIVFPFLRDGELILAKVREAVDGAKPKPTEAGCEKILFGWQAVSTTAREILITEGEIDALSMAAYTSIPALSVPFGGGGGNKQDWIENEYDRLSRFETIYLCLDNDEVGAEGTAEIVKRLGRHRCRIVKLPRKDANQCLVDGVSASEILDCITKSATLDPAELVPTHQFTDNVIGLFWPKEGVVEGYTLPFYDAAGKIIFRPGEVSVWTGPSGSGKSQILSHTQIHWVHQGSRLCVASLEMSAPQMLRRMVKQAANVDRPTEVMIRATMDWLDPGVLIYNHVGKTSVERLLEVFDYARAKYGCDQFIIDSLMRLGLATDDYNGQEQVMFRIVEWAVNSGAHVHLVAHSRKADKRFKSVPDTEDIKGAMEVGANAFNILSVWRDRDREETAQFPPPTDPKELDVYNAMMARPGVVLNVAKQRNGDWEGKIYLWFNQDTYQYRGTQDHKHGRSYVDLPQPQIEQDIG